MNTPLQNGMGHIYGPGKTIASSGIQPVWLEQNGSRVFGGLINLQDTYKSGLKIVDLYPESIRTGTPCVKIGNKCYPIPTFRVVGDVTSEGTTLVLAGWEGLAVPKQGLNVALPDGSKTLALPAMSKTAEGNYTMTITADALGELKDGDVLVLQDATVFDYKTVVPSGLTKDNLLYRGADPNSKLNVSLVDEGRIIDCMAAPVPGPMKAALQTVKFEEI